MKIPFLKTFIISSLLWFPVQTFAQVTVSASIRPLQAIAAAITDGVLVPEVLVGSGASPHHYSLRPSERRLISNSDVVLWIGPLLEPHLETLDIQTQALWIQALELDGMNLQIQGSAIDQHLWLDAGNAEIIAQALSKALSELDTVNAEKYQANFQQFQKELALVDESIHQKFSHFSIPDSPNFVVYHNAFLYFEKRYGLEHLVSVVEQEDISPGIRHLLNVRRQIEEHRVECVLVDPDVNIAELETMLGNDNLHYTVIDVLGWDVEMSASAYPGFLNGIADAILECLR